MAYERGRGHEVGGSEEADAPIAASGAANRAGAFTAEAAQYATQVRPSAARSAPRVVMRQSQAGVGGSRAPTRSLLLLPTLLD